MSIWGKVKCWFDSHEWGEWHKGKVGWVAHVPLFGKATVLGRDVPVRARWCKRCGIQDELDY